ncbi:hypothetical protein Lfu02_77830 [Longispora fulva]|uniref:Uncharacterized protein n=1 Tax=Longispora fulva TaxID=619741 RepID=A0A8J7KFI5_9ACTN|nr:hypothetical protein [Longispora fulva]MBG6136230.1 hypothetical protein [Longispora fulva]GIG63411.1 hypothetical protein Lfu02_77830 [Longispora fulva]
MKWKPPKNTTQAAASGDTITRLRVGMLDAAHQLGVKSTVVVWSRGLLDWSEERIQPEILRWLYERIEMLLEEQRENGIAMADRPGGGNAAHGAWMARALTLTQSGTQYVQANRVLTPIVTAPSNLLAEFQLADLVTAATTQAIAGRDNGLKLVPHLKNLARTSYYGTIGGAGLVLWPRPAMLDLHYWVFGERVYVQGGAQTTLGPTGDPFSPPGRPFQNDDGIPPSPPALDTATATAMITS